MSIEGYCPPSLTPDELKTLVTESFEDGPGGVKESFHARFHHLERGISEDDVIHGLEKNWVFERDPEFNKDEWQWKYRILTETIEGDLLVVLIAVNTRERTFEVVTRW